MVHKFDACYNFNNKLVKEFAFGGGGKLEGY